MTLHQREHAGRNFDGQAHVTGDLPRRLPVHHHRPVQIGGQGERNARSTSPQLVATNQP